MYIYMTYSYVYIILIHKTPFSRKRLSLVISLFLKDVRNSSCPPLKIISLLSLIFFGSHLN